MRETGKYAIHALVVLGLLLPSVVAFTRGTASGRPITLLAAADTNNIDVSNLSPPTAHVQSLFGKADPYLQGIHSIHPTTKALTDMGVVPQPSDHLDFTQLVEESWLPGFAPTQGILPLHTMPPDTPASFAGQVQWAAAFLNVIDQLPYVALAYCLVEFLLLRPSIDRYREDVEDSPEEALTETIAVTSVRVGMFALLAAVTTTLFG